MRLAIYSGAHLAPEAVYWRQASPDLAPEAELVAPPLYCKTDEYS